MTGRVLQGHICDGRHCYFAHYIKERQTKYQTDLGLLTWARKQSLMERS